MMKGRESSRWANSRTKRALDVALVVSTSPLWLPVAGVVACAVSLAHGRPVLFRQVRPGRHGKPFTMWKFRTMTSARGEAGQLLPDEQRLTRFGRFLRRTSLDELPELFNVLRGDMSLVGPRPLLMEYLDRYTKEQARRHDVRPGPTGWVQVNGRNALTWEKKFELDVWYVRNASAVLDVAILAKTVRKVLLGDGVASVGHATMPRFMGATPTVAEIEGGRS